MKVMYLWQGVVSLFLAFAVSFQAFAGEPTEQIKQTTDRIISILTDPALKEPARAEERRKLIRKAADERFDWEEMARRSLARHWAGRTDEEKREFIPLFSDLLERTYMDKVEGYSGEKVVYEGETVEGDFGVVKVEILTATDTEISVEYRVRRKGNGWFIYDVSIEGVSLVNNYRSQFNSIILRSSYRELIKRLEAKLAKK
jgi:phospholipid transport system substrate-binding protein